MEDGCPIGKRGKVFCKYDTQIIYLFLKILRLTTETRSPFEEDMFEHSPYVILCDDMLEGLVGKGCRGAEDGVGDGLDK